MNGKRAVVNNFNCLKIEEIILAALYKTYNAILGLAKNFGIKINR